MDVIEVAKEIESRIKLLGEGRKQILEKARRKSETISNYERKIAIVLIKLKNGEPMGLEGNVVEKCPASIMEKIARGICWEEKLAMEQADAEYKLTIGKMRSIEAELNGFQSIYRHLDKM